MGEIVNRIDNSLIIRRVVHSSYSIFVNENSERRNNLSNRVPYFRFASTPSSPSAVTISDFCVYSKQCQYSLTPSSQQENHITRFHPCFEENTILSEDNTVAQSDRFYNNSVTFSEYPLKSGEIFLIEIGKSEYSSCLSMDIGLAQSEVLSACRTITSIWHQYPPRVLHRRDIYWNSVPKEALDGFWPHWCHPCGEKKFFIEGNFLRTSRGLIPLSFFKSTDVGSRLGIVFVPTDKQYADMHIIINGKDFGPSRQRIPYQEGPLHAAIRICCGGKVRIIQIHHTAASLQILSKDAIVQCLNKKSSEAESLPLPEQLKDYVMEG